MTDDDYIMTFGKHNGTPIGEVPASYLLWIWDAGLWRVTRGSERDPVRQYIIANFNHLETECPDRIIEHRP